MISVRCSLALIVILQRNNSMKYSSEDVMQYIENEDVKFIRLAFCDVFGKQKNISVMPNELRRAFGSGIAFDASAVRGFGGDVFSDLFLHPDPSTLSVLPWRPEHGRVVRMYCSVKTQDGRVHSCDTRSLLAEAAKKAKTAGTLPELSAKPQFYLFRTDDSGEPTGMPFDSAGYLDIAPLDRGENVRRQICLTLEAMGIRPESSCHMEGGGQNEISFHSADPLTTADNTMSFVTVVKTSAGANGLWADLSPKPVSDRPGSGMCIWLSYRSDPDGSLLRYAAAGIRRHLPEMTLFLDPTEDSYRRLNSEVKEPVKLTGDRILVSSPAPLANPYIAFTLLMAAAAEGISSKAEPDDGEITLPGSLLDAKRLVSDSTFIKENLPQEIIDSYTDI